MKRTLATLGVVGLGLISLTAPAIAASDRVVVCHDDGDGTWTALEFDANGIGGHRQHVDDIIPPTPKALSGLNWTNDGKITYIANCAPLPPGETPPIYPPVVDPPVVVVPPVVVDPPVVVVPPVVVDPPVVVVPPVVNPPVVEPPAVTPVVEQPTVVEPPATVVEPVAEAPAAVVPPAVAPVVAPPAAAPVTGSVVVPAQPAAVQVPAGAAATASTSLGTNQGYNAQTAVGGPESSPAWLGGLGALAAAGAAVAARRRSAAS